MPTDGRGARAGAGEDIVVRLRRLYAQNGTNYVEEAAAEIERLRAEAGRRVFWVIERFESGRSGGYWDGGSSRSFTNDINSAIQFCRRVDCYWATRGWHWTDTKPTEHMMLPATLAAKETL